MALPGALVGGFPTAYVGRDGLLERLTELWQGATNGTPAAVLLGGEPGVGKTRTAAELAQRVYADGATVLYGGTQEGLNAPYQPFVEALSWYTARDPIGPLGQLPGELVRLLPALSTVVEELPAPVAADPASEQHRLFEATASWLVDAAARDALLLVLDDLHWATKPTLLLVNHVLQSAQKAGARVLVLMTHRDTEVDRAHPLTKLNDDVERIRIDNLAAADVVALMEADAGQPLDAERRSLAAAIHAQTEGNPFFVSEVLRHQEETATITIPDSVRDVVHGRVARLSANASDVLSLAAVQGRDIDIEVLGELTDGGTEMVRDALDEAVQAGLFAAPTPDEFRFAHALVRTTLYDELSAVRRGRVHARIAETLEQLRADDVVALAYHCAAAGDTAGAVRYGLAAGEEALTARAFSDAEDRFTEVLTLLGDDDSPARVAALCGLGESQRDQGNPVFRETLLDASRCARALGDTALLVRAVLANSRGMSSMVGALDDDRVEFIEIALDAIGTEPSADRARLLAQLSSEVLFGFDHARRLALADEAEAMARELDDKATLAWVLARTGYAAVVPSRWERWLARQEEGVQLADATGDPSLRVISRTLYAGALLLAGRIEDALEINDDMVAIADAEAAPTERWLAHVSALPNTLAREGVVANAARNDECLAMGQDAGIADALQWWAAAGSGPYWLTAQAEVIADAAGLFAAQFPNHKIWYTGWALMLADAGRHDEARAVIDTYGLRGLTLEDGSLPLVGTAQLAVLCFELDDVEIAESIVPVLEKYVGRWGHYFLYVVGPITWSLGCALSVLGEYDRAVPLLEDALAELLRLGFRDHAAHCRCGLARILLRRDAPGDKERAVALLAEARTHADAIPAPNLVARIEAITTQ